MAATYHTSTQHENWTSEGKPEWSNAGAGGSNEEFPETRLLMIYLQQQLTKLGRRLNNVRQLVYATAMVFIHRFHTRVNIRRTNPYLVASTAFYLACKIEECPQHIRLVTNEARNLWPEFMSSDTCRIGECEFIMISEMQAQLVVHHPYRHLLILQKQLGLAQAEVSLAWSVVNDHYLTSLPILQTPQTIALAAVVLAVAVRPSQGAVGGTLGGTSVARNLQVPVMQNRGQALLQCLLQSSVDTESIIECTQEMISLYVMWEDYSEKTCKEQIGRHVKAKGLDR